MSRIECPNCRVGEVMLLADHSVSHCTTGCTATQIRHADIVDGTAGDGPPGRPWLPLVFIVIVVILGAIALRAL